MSETGDLFSQPKADEPRTLTVSQVTQKVKGLLEMEVGDIWIRGEISGYKPSAAGHIYFSLKDDGAVLSCALFRGAASRNKSLRSNFQLRDGLEVIAHGKISVYAPRGSYQLIIDYVEPVGAGALQRAFEELKSKLSKEGLFDPARKKEIPQHPTKIAIVTSPTGAALQDMLNVLERRHSGISILVVPTLVQGDDAAPQIVKAIETVNEHELADVIVIARGGGSIEDLWCFNDERVVRAVVDSKIPTISAVGHEIDFTLCDFAADLRAPTPSAAAELVSKNLVELIDSLLSSEQRLVSAMRGRISRLRSNVFALENRLASPAEKLIRLKKRLDELFLNLQNLLNRNAALKRSHLESLVARLEALSPLKVLGRGYSLVRDEASGEVVKSVKHAVKNKEVSVMFHDGKAKAKFI